MTTCISITSHIDRQTYAAAFEPVRQSNHMALGWAQIDTAECDLRFPAIIIKAQSKIGYTVYTVRDWQAPAISFGDIADPLDWAILTATGCGRFINPRLERAEPINVRELDLPLTEDEMAMFARLRA